MNKIKNELKYIGVSFLIIGSIIGLFFLFVYMYKLLGRNLLPILFGLFIFFIIYVCVRGYYKDLENR